MTAVVICRSGKTRRGFRLTAPKRHAAMAHLNTIWRRSGPQGSSAIYGANVAPMGPAVVVINCTVNSVRNLSAISIRCQFRSGGHARFQLLQKALRCVAHAFQVFLSPLLHALNQAWSRKHEVQRNSASGAQSSE